MSRMLMQPSSVHAQFMPNYKSKNFSTYESTRYVRPTAVNICTVKRGKAAATAERIITFAANAEALYILKKN